MPSKKQQKALAFRQKSKGKQPEAAVLDVPEHDLDLDDAPAPAPAPTTGKRKRESEDAKPTPKKRKQSQAQDGDGVEAKGDGVEAKGDGEGPKGDGEAPAAEDASSKGKVKYILFLGNLRYTTTAEQIAKHFEACIPPPTIRLLTPKPKTDASGKTRIAKSKGCAFLEFKSHNTLQQGLKLHGSELDGRKINVELTAGGGGKSAARLDKVRARNQTLLQERKQRLVKSAAAPDEDAASETLKPQRHSNTSGADRADVVAKRKTWSVPEGDESTGRGGVKHKKRGKKTGSGKGASKPWLSGANAIAVE